mmetsp:Transcript_43212/g.85214  ORF Transcript_43212/g.85214 Transcript_43212/m.85214 type:complete len:219 (+) Transcript_43212:2091-2747(+)
MDRPKQLDVVDAPLCLHARLCHDLDGLDRELPSCGFSREHHCVRAIQDCIGHVCHLSPCGPRVFHHRLQHLSRSHHRLACHVALCDHHLLCEEDFLWGDLHTQVPSCHHDAIRLRQDVIEVQQTLNVLNLRDDPHVPTPRSEKVPNLLDVLSRLNEGGGNKRDTVGNAEVQNVVLVLLSNHRKIHFHSRQVTVLSFSQFCRVHHLCDHVVLSTLQNFA